MTNKLQNFERAFSDNSGSSVATCNCGKKFYDAVLCTGLSEYEVKELEKEKATPLGWDASFMSFEGQQFVMDCSCWKPRAEQIMGFLDSHAHKIAAYFKLEKERKMIEAQSSAEVTP